MHRETACYVTRFNQAPAQTLSFTKSQWAELAAVCGVAQIAKQTADSNMVLICAQGAAFKRITAGCAWRSQCHGSTDEVRWTAEATVILLSAANLERTCSNRAALYAFTRFTSPHATWPSPSCAA